MTESREGAAAHATHVPVLTDPPELTPAVSRGFDWFYAAAIGTWIASGMWPLASIANGRFTGMPAVIYVVAFLAFGAALIAILVLPRRRTRPPIAVPIALAVTESIAALIVNADTAIYLRGTGVGVGLLVIVAAQLPYFLSSPAVWIWIAIQTSAMIGFVNGIMNGGFIEGATFAMAALGFQAFAAASSILAISEGRARTNLARTNAELTATRELLAESSRTSERLRISRDLHDTLGHHLTALSLQLDVATRLSEGKVADHVQQAHAITRLLLSDVRDVVSTLRDSSRLNLAAAIRTLVLQPVGARVHVEVSENLVVDDAERAEALLRAVQEILTNTARHGCAADLWITLHNEGAGVRLQARDNGRGTKTVAFGNGLTGMRERFEQHGGHIEVTSAGGTGFEVRAFMPLSPST